MVQGEEVWARIYEAATGGGCRVNYTLQPQLLHKCPLVK